MIGCAARSPEGFLRSARGVPRSCSMTIQSPCDADVLRATRWTGWFTRRFNTRCCSAISRSPTPAGRTGSTNSPGEALDHRAPEHVASEHRTLRGVAVATFWKRSCSMRLLDQLRLRSSGFSSSNSSPPRAAAMRATSRSQRRRH